MDLHAIRNYTYMLLGDSSAEASEYYPAHFIDEFINAGYREIVEASEDLEKNTTLSVTDGTRYVSLPSDFESVKVLLYRNYELQFKQFQDFDWLSNSGKGTPMFYAIREQKIWLDPIPHETGTHLTLYYYYIPTALSLNADTPTIPSSFHHYLAYYAAGMAKLGKGDMNRGDYFKGIFEQGKKQLRIRATSRRSNQDFFQVRDEYFFE